MYLLRKRLISNVKIKYTTFFHNYKIVFKTMFKVVNKLLLFFSLFITYFYKQ